MIDHKIFQSGFVWNYREAILPISLVGIPLTVEIFNLSYSARKNPEGIKAKITHIKHAFLTTQKNNLIDVARKIFCFTAALTCPFILLSKAFALPVALIAIQLIASVYPNIQQIPKQISQIKEYLNDAFTQRAEETLHLFNQRRWEAIKKIACYTLLFTGAMVALGYASYLGLLASRAETIWKVADLLPFQNNMVVIAEYLILSALHIKQALHYYQENKSRAAFHLLSAGLGVFFPAYYGMQKTPVRLHHSFTGLLLQLAPWRPVRCLGLVMSADSFLYTCYKDHGKAVLYDENGKVSYISESFDFMNIFWNHFSYALTAISSSCLLHRFVKQLEDSKKNPHRCKNAAVGFNLKDINP